MSPVLDISNIRLTYDHGKRVVLEDVSAALVPGALTALIGRNGAGKSSLLQAIMRQVPIDGGDISLGGKPIDQLTIEARSKMVSIVHTSLVDLGYMTVFDLVALGRSPFTRWTGRLEKNDRLVIEKTLVAMGIAPLQSRYIYELSDGERQKTIIARALVQDTPIILMDEPIAFIDPVASLEILQLLRHQCHQQGKSILYSTHDLGSAYISADQFWLLGDKGDLVSGNPSELVKNGSVQQSFGRQGYVLSESLLGFIPEE